MVHEGLEFPDVYYDFPARFFSTTMEAQEFTALLARLEISYRVLLHSPPKRLDLPMQTVVVLLEVANGGSVH